MVIEPDTAETFWLVVPAFALLITLTAGLAMMFAAVNVYFRDVSHLLGVLFLPWYFLTPVLYTFGQLPGAASHPHLVTALRYGNPVTPYVEVIRDAVLAGAVPAGGRAALHLARRARLLRARPAAVPAPRGQLRDRALVDDDRILPGDVIVDDVSRRFLRNPGAGPIAEADDRPARNRSS